MDTNGTNTAVVLATISLGDGNVGDFGPTALDTAAATQARQDVTLAKYIRTFNKAWICGDGRPGLGLTDDGATAAGQILGGIAETDTAADAMLPSSAGITRSAALAENTKRNAELYTVYVHGDSKRGKAGCKAIVEARATLRRLKQYQEVVMPLTIKACELLSLNVPETDIRSFIETAATVAADDHYWDTTPEIEVDIQVANGAQYIELDGDHKEAGALVIFSEGTFANVPFNADHTDTNGIRLANYFAVSLGQYIAEIRKQSRFAGDIAAQDSHIARALLFNIGTAKTVGNASLDMTAIVYGQ